MAYLSIAQRAKRMFKPGTGELRGGTLHIVYHEPPSGPHTGRFDNACARLGTRPVAYAYSYSTLVATLVANENTGQHEFWLTSERYSPTTDRHCRLLLAGWHEFAPDVAEANLYRFAMHVDTHRCSAIRLSRAVRAVWRTSFPLIVSKGRHEATRVAALHDALRLVDGALRIVTKDVPLDALLNAHGNFAASAAELAECVVMRDMLQGFTALSVPQLRATVSGLLALEHDDSTERR